MFDLSFLLGGSVVAVLAVQILKDLYGKVSQRWGSLIAQLSLLIVSFAVAGIGAAFQFLPPQIIETTGIIFASAMAIYEVLYKALYQQAIKGVQK